MIGEFEEVTRKREEAVRVGYDNLIRLLSLTEGPIHASGKLDTIVQAVNEQSDTSEWNAVNGYVLAVKNFILQYNYFFSLMNKGNVPKNEYEASMRAYVKKKSLLTEQERFANIVHERVARREDVSGYGDWEQIAAYTRGEVQELRLLANNCSDHEAFIINYEMRMIDLTMENSLLKKIDEKLFYHPS